MPVKLIETKLNDILSNIGVTPAVEVEKQDDTYLVTIDGEDLSFLIGYRGEALNALQTLLATMLFNELNDWIHVVVDINGYRKARQTKIEDMVRNFIDRVRFHGTDVDMPSMNAYERRLVHMFVSDYPDIISESFGEGRARHVVLRLKGEE